MPEFIDILNETYESNCREIAQLCEDREETNLNADLLFQATRDLDTMLEIELARIKRLDEIDGRIDQLYKGSQKLLARMEMAS